MRVPALMSRERIATIGVTLESSYELTGYDDISDLLAAMQQTPHGAVLIEAGLIRQPASVRKFSRLAQTYHVLIFAVPADMDLLFCHTDIARSPLSHIVAAEGPNVLLDVLSIPRFASPGQSASSNTFSAGTETSVPSACFADSMQRYDQPR